MINPELIIENRGNRNECYVVTCAENDIIATTSNHDLAQHISDYLVKQYGRSCVQEYRNVDVTYFIAVKDTALAHDVEVFINELQLRR